MKTIMHLIETSGPGGAEKMLISLVDHLEKGSYRSIVCLLKDGWLREQFQRRGVETFILPLNWSFDIGWLGRFVAFLRKHKVDLMHAHEFAMNTYGSFASALSGIPIVTTVHGKSYYWKYFRRRMAYRFVSRQSKMVAVSEDIARGLCQAVGIRPNRIRIIYNGIETDLFHPNQKTREQIRRELQVTDEQSVIGTIGNLYPVKGHTYLVRAAAAVTQVFPESVFIIAGRGQLLEGLQTEARELGVEKHIRFLGFREDVPALLQAMDIFVLPSLSEGLPLSALEAMASGKPVVATRVGGVPEVVADSETGFLVAPEDADGLAEKLVCLLKAPFLAQQLGAAGRERVKERFSLDRMEKEYEELYDTALLGRYRCSPYRY